MKAFAAALLALCAAAGLTPFAATAGDGSLTRVRGKAACLSVGGRHGCVPVRGVDHFNRIAVSPGGGSVYVSSNGVAAFRRNARTGRLQQLRGRGGCVRARGARGCGRANGLGGASVIIVSQDGRNIYVGSARRDSIVVLRRSRRTGALRQLPGVAGCISVRPLVGCSLGRALAGVSAFALSRDGRFLYAGTWSATGGGGIAVLDLIRQVIDAGVVRPRLDEQDRPVPVLTQTGGQNRAGRTCSEHDVVILHPSASRDGQYGGSSGLGAVPRTAG